MRNLQNLQTRYEVTLHVKTVSGIVQIGTLEVYQFILEPSQLKAAAMARFCYKAEPITERKIISSDAVVPMWVARNNPKAIGKYSDFFVSVQGELC